MYELELKELFYLYFFKSNRLVYFLLTIHT